MTLTRGRNYISSDQQFQLPMKIVSYKMWLTQEALISLFIQGMELSTTEYQDSLRKHHPSLESFPLSLKA